MHMATYFAVRIIVECAKVPQGELVSGSYIAKAIDMTYGYFCKLSNSLIKSGILASVQGRNGGYYLPKDAKSISLYDIQEATKEKKEPDMRWGNDKVAEYYLKLEKQMNDSLKGQTIDMFV